MGVDGTGSAAGEDGGPAIASYDWTVGGTNLGGSSSFSSNFSSSMGVTLSVTDQDGATASLNGSVTIDPVDPCDDPFTRTVEDCDSNPPSADDAVSYDGDSSEPGDYAGGSPTSKLVCYVTDWFEWNGSHWVYQNSHTDYCTFE